MNSPRRTIPKDSLIQLRSVIADLFRLVRDGVPRAEGPAAA